jgi:hypothetical protein
MLVRLEKTNSEPSGSPGAEGAAAGRGGDTAAGAVVAVRQTIKRGARMNEVARRVVLRSLRPIVEKRLSLPKRTLKLELADNGHDVVGTVRTDEYRVLVEEALWADLSAATSGSPEEVREKHRLEDWVALKLQEQIPR